MGRPDSELSGEVAATLHLVGPAVRSVAIDGSRLVLTQQPPSLSVRRPDLGEDLTGFIPRSSVGARQTLPGYWASGGLGV